MKVTIVIPIYNVEQYIEKCLDSVVAQTYRGEIECILVDDCGNDKSVDIVNQYLSDKGRWRMGNESSTIRMIHHEHNRGLSAARNSGTEVATGDYVYYLDSDDELTPGAIEALTEVAKKYKGVDVVQGATRTVPVDDEYYGIGKYVDRNSKEKGQRDPKERHAYYEGNEWIRREYYRIKGGIPVNAWNKLIRREFITENGLWFKEGIIHEDQHWMFFAVKKMKSIAFASEITYLHNRNNESIMKASGIEKSNNHWGKILLDITEHIDEPYRIEQVKKYAVAMITRYSDTADYREVKQRIGREIANEMGTIDKWLYELWSWKNNVITRIMIRRWLKL